MSTKKTKKLSAVLALSLLAGCGVPESDQAPDQDPVASRASELLQPVGDPARPEPLEVFRLGPGSQSVHSRRPPAPASALLVSGQILLIDGHVEANLDVMQEDAWVLDAVVTLNGRALPFVPSAHGYFARIPASEFSSDSYLLEVSAGGRRESRTITMPGALLVNAPQQVLAGTSFSVSWSAVQGASTIRGILKSQAGWYGSFEYFSANANRYVYSGVSTLGEATLELRATRVEEGWGIEVQRVERKTILVVE